MSAGLGASGWDVPVRWSLGASAWTLRERATRRAIERVAAAGYQGIELAVSEPVALAEIRWSLAASGLEACAIAPGVSGLDCAHPSARLRRAALDHLGASLELALELGAPVIIVVPSDCSEPVPRSTREDNLARAAETIAEAAALVPVGGPSFVIEALNRYETYLVRTLAEAEALRAAIDSPHVALMADVFHMGIEEDCTAESIRAHADQIRYVHLADNQRREPGSGQLDIAGALAALSDSGYHGYLTMEFLPATDQALRSARSHVAELAGIPA
jgi:sugar phosphate isomerase/epimerase